MISDDFNSLLQVDVPSLSQPHAKIFRSRSLTFRCEIIESRSLASTTAHMQQAASTGSNHCPQRYGREFTLVRLGHNGPAGEEIVEAAVSRGVPITVQTIRDPEPVAIYDARLVLVRPDGHVAWRGGKAPAEPMTVIDRIRGGSP